MSRFDFTEAPGIEKLREFHRYVATKEKLNLGSNSDLRNTYINVDILDFPGLDVRCDIRELHKYFNRESLSEVIAYDVVEHFSFNETTGLIKEWISWLKKDGLIIIRVPDLEKLSRAIINKTLPIWTAQQLLYGGQTTEFDYHCAGWSGESLEGVMLGCGCSQIIQVVREEETYNVTVVGKK